jgi:hypothetical protein
LGNNVEGDENFHQFFIILATKNCHMLYSGEREVYLFVTIDPIFTFGQALQPYVHVLVGLHDTQYKEPVN